MLSKIKKNEALVIMSIFMLPKDLLVRNIIIKLIKENNIEIHFLFENKVVKGNKNIKLINEFFFLDNLDI
tara:strand:- start:335 stop:544 length:210 start_codon:yes stop_codon:yes gene_type:complete